MSVKKRSEPTLDPNGTLQRILLVEICFNLTDFIAVSNDLGNIT